jgi:hypothetical protein
VTPRSWEHWISHYDGPRRGEQRVTNVRITARCTGTIPLFAMALIERTDGVPFDWPFH